MKQYKLTGFKSNDWEKRITQNFKIQFPVIVTTDDGFFYLKNIHGSGHLIHIDIFEVEPIV